MFWGQSNNPIILNRILMGTYASEKNGQTRVMLVNVEQQKKDVVNHNIILFSRRQQKFQWLMDRMLDGTCHKMM